jgi:hypothetical protein
MASNRQWAEVMSDRLWEGISNEYDARTKDLIIQAFLGGLASYPDLLEELKSSSLIELNYFDNEFPREVSGKNWKLTIRHSKKS